MRGEILQELSGLSVGYFLRAGHGPLLSSQPMTRPAKIKRCAGLANGPISSISAGEMFSFPDPRTFTTQITNYSSREDVNLANQRFLISIRKNIFMIRNKYHTYMSVRCNGRRNLFF